MLFESRLNTGAKGRLLRALASCRLLKDVIAACGWRARLRGAKARVRELSRFEDALASARSRALNVQGAKIRFL